MRAPEPCQQSCHASTQEPDLWLSSGVKMEAIDLQCRRHGIVLLQVESMTWKRERNDHCASHVSHASRWACLCTAHPQTDRQTQKIGEKKLVPRHRFQPSPKFLSPRGESFPVNRCNTPALLKLNFKIETEMARKSASPSNFSSFRTSFARQACSCHTFCCITSFKRLHCWL